MISCRPCVLCLGTAREIEFGLSMGTVVRCVGCSLVSMVDRTGDLVRCSYNEKYYRRAGAPGPGYDDYFGAESEARREIAHALAGMVLSLAVGTPRVLDLGCGGGFLVHALAGHGVETTGVDASDHAIEWAREGAGGGRFLRAGVGAPCLVDSPPFDVVTMIDVIEHLPDPIGALRWAASLMRRGGTLVVLTPRYGGRLLAEQGAAYVHFDSDHMYYFTEETLRAVITRAMEPSQIETEDVLTLVRKQDIPVPDSMARKYGTDRESMFTVVTL